MCKFLHVFSNLEVDPACIFHFVEDSRPLVASASVGERTSGAEGRSPGGRVSASKEDDRTEETDSVKIIVPVCLLGEP